MIYKALKLFFMNEYEKSGIINESYERGKFIGNGKTWEVGIVEVGAGNATAAVDLFNAQSLAMF